VIKTLALFKIAAVRLVVVVVAASLVGGCSGIGRALGFSKRPPDEFEVLARAPLVVPPDFNLRPPAEEELGLRERNPRAQAYAALFPAKPKTAMPALSADDVGVAPLGPDTSGPFFDDISDPEQEN